MISKCLLRKFILSILLVFGTSSVFAETVAAIPVIIDGKYQISTLAELRWVSENPDSWNGDFIITANIDASETSTWNATGEPVEYLGFSPIGSSSRKFTGSFDNNEAYTISNLYIKRTYRTGFFGYTYQASIRGISLENVNISGTAYVGGLIGRSDDTLVRGCHVSGDVLSTNGYVGVLIGYGFKLKLESCTASGDLVANSSLSGGLVGSLDSSDVFACGADVQVLGEDSSGGLFGLASYSMIHNSYSLGNVSGANEVGGFIGMGYSSFVSNSFSAGSVNGSATSGAFLGSDEFGDYEIYNCFFDNDNSDLDAIGNDSEKTGVLGLPTASLYLQSTFEEADWNFSHVWEIGDSYPALTGFVGTPASEPVLQSNEYQISTLAELRWISENPSSWDADFAIVANIDASETAGWEGGRGFNPIGETFDTFNGSISNDGFVIDGLTIYAPLKTDVGFIGLMGNNSSQLIKGVILENLNVTGEATVGGLLGRSYGGGEIFDCHTGGKVKALKDTVGGLVAGHSNVIINSHSSADVSTEGLYAGGLVGRTFSSAKVYTSFATGNVRGYERCGGLIGEASYVYDCYATGNVVAENNFAGGLIGRNYSGNILNCFSIGTVNCPGDYVGALCGDGSTIENSFFDMTRSGFSASEGAGDYPNHAGIIGLSSEEMRVDSNFVETSWDFNYLWTMGTDHPILRGYEETRAEEPRLIGGVYQISNLAELRWVSETNSS
ncbi:MAG: hypothetical protein NE330_15340, partial [Lentisphaeraceae bacterium]|nr:hypothetical protein [Lentisphaeraceae bacterium]